MSAGLTGTGLYAVNYLGKRQKAPGSAAAAAPQPAPRASVHDFDLPAELKDKKSSAGCLLFVVSVVALIAYWPVGLALLAGVIIWQFARPHTPEDHARGLFFQGQRALEKNDQAGALESFKKAVEIKPEMPVLWLKIADLEREQGKFADAEAAYEKAIEHGKNDPEVQFHLAWTLINENKPEKAIEVLQGLPAETKQDLPVINALATCFLGTDRPQAALEVLQQGPTRKRNLDDQMVVYHYIFGVTYKQLGDKEKAAAHLSKVIAANEGYLDAKELLEQLNAPDVK
jgi:tetratricopeptide (TPR) repeat protein